MGYMKFVIMVPTGKRTHKPILEWNQNVILDKVIQRMLKKHDWRIEEDLKEAFQETIEEFKKGTTKLPY